MFKMYTQIFSDILRHI